jgi:hypothetical protein
MTRWATLCVAGLLCLAATVGAGTAAAVTTAPRLLSLRGKQVPLTLANGMFPDSGHPQAIAYVPPAYTGAQPVDLVVFVHGWRGCAQVIINDDEAPCEEGGDSTHAYHLADFLAASGKDAILLVLQGPYDQRSNDDGAMATPGTFSALITEALAQLSKAAGEPNDAPALALGNIQLVAHSGAVKAVADILNGGGLDDHLVEVDLLDVLYSQADTFASWEDRQALAASADMSRRRFVVIYTCCAGTFDESRALQTRSLPAAATEGDPPDHPIRAVDHVADELPAVDLGAPILFAESDVDHSALPLVYVPQLLATSSLRALPGPASGPSSRPR